MATSLTATQMDKIVGLRAVAQAMIYEVAAKAVGAFLPTVAKFQTVWNGTRTEIALAAQMASGTRVTIAAVPLLVVDGQYGPKTAGALGIVTQGGGFTAPPPTRASAVTVWLAQNQGAVGAMYSLPDPPQIVNDPGAGQAQVPASPSASPNGNLPQDVLDAVNGSAATTMVVTTKPGPQASQATYVDITPTQVIAAVSQQSVQPGIVPMTPGAAASGSDITFSPEEANAIVAQHLQPGAITLPPLTVLGTSRTNKAPWIAGLAVLTVLGGAFWFMGSKGGGTRRRRRAMA